LRSSTLARRIADLTLTRKAHDVVIMDLRGLTSMADFFVICSADSDVQVKAIANAVEEGLEKKGAMPWHKESGSVNWVLLDYVDVVLHIFHKQIRGFYNLERLWGDAGIAKVSDERTKIAGRKPARARVARKIASTRRKVAS